MEMPAAPSELVVDKETGLPLSNQKPEQPEEAEARRAAWQIERETARSVIAKAKGEPIP